MALQVKCGSFAKTTAAATASQAITGVGFQPAALIVWTDGTLVNQTWTNDHAACVGIATGASNQFSLEAYAAAAANSYLERITLKILSLVPAAVNPGAEASLVSLDADGFTLSWTTNNAQATIINYLAIGGSGITGAKAVQSQFPASTAAVSITGVGFRPDLVIHLTPFTSPAFPTSFANFFSLAIGAMDGAGNQFNMVAGATSTSNQTRWQASNRTAGAMAPTPGSQRQERHYGSMDVDGFTLPIADSGAANIGLFSLCLKGDGFKVGTLSKSTSGAPASQSVSGLGFQPSGLLTASIFDTNLNSYQSHIGWGIGGASSTSDRHAIALTNRQSAAAAKSYSDDAHLALKADNSTPAIDAAADLTSFDSDGFTLNWGTNDAVATKVHYIAMGSAAAAPSVGFPFQSRSNRNVLLRR